MSKQTRNINFSSGFLKVIHFYSRPSWLALFVFPLFYSSLLYSAPVADDSELTPQFISITPFYIDADGKRNATEGRGLRISYGRSLTDKWYWETDGSAAILETGTSMGMDEYQFAASTGLSWSLYDRDPSHWTPYAIGMIGAVYNDAQPDSLDGTDFTLAAGVGAVTRSLFKNSIRLRAEVRHVYDTYAHDRNDLHFSAGIEIPLQGGKVVERVVYIDRFTEVAQVTPEDPDSDGDGVPDSRDLCPDTLPGARVDASGCIIEAQTIALSNVAFELNSDQLTPSSRTALDAIAVSLKGQSELTIEIAGHTDSQGSVDYNMDLSQRRANSVREYLLGEGVEAQQLNAKGYGPHEPVADNGSVSGRAMNRRVEFRISK